MSEARRSLKGAMKPLTPSEKRLFSRWCGRRKWGNRVVVDYQIEFRDIPRDDFILFVELLDKMGEAALDYHDVGAMRVRKIRANGRRFL